LEEFLSCLDSEETPSGLRAEPKTEFTTKVSYCVNCCDLGCSYCLSYPYLSPVAADTTSHPSSVSTTSSPQSSIGVISTSPPNATHSTVSPVPFHASQPFSLSPPDSISPERKAITASSQRFKCSMCQQSFPTNMELRSAFNYIGRAELTVVDHTSVNTPQLPRHTRVPHATELSQSSRT